jgi:two-component system, NtrC family, sensor kinase
VLNTLLESAARLSEADKGVILRPTGNDASYYVAASYRHTPEFKEHQTHLTFAPGRSGAVSRVLLEGKSVQIPDVLADPEYKLREIARLGDFRTILGVPLFREAIPIGVLLLQRAAVRPFTDKQIKLVETFADQAVIAIENVRLFEAEQQRTRELSESLEQQTATSEVLQVISSSPGDLEPVFETMLENAVRICVAKFGGIYRIEGDTVCLVATHADVPAAYAGARRFAPFRPGPKHYFGRMMAARTVLHIDDTTAEQGYVERRPEYVAAVELGGVRTFMAVPMLKEGEPIGAFLLARQETRSFTEKQIALVTSFAAQAVIAIENTRLLNELRQRTNDLTERTADLTEALERQTATSEVLQAISSSSGDLDPVFATMLENAVRICDAKFGNIYHWDGEVLHLLASHNTPPAFAEARKHSPLRPPPETPVGRMLAHKAAFHSADMAAHPGYIDRSDPGSVAAVELGGVRTILAIPMLKENELSGSFSVYRQEVRPFTDKQIALVTSFASQAVIAIENVRLLNELRESLEQQTATSEVLQVISTASGDLEPVFASMLENAVRISGAKFGIIHGWDGENSRLMATHNLPAAFDEARRRASQWRPGPKTAIRRMVATKKVVHIPNLVKDETYVEDRSPQVVAAVELGRVRTMLAVPMLKDEEVIGAFTVYRQEVRPFTDKQIDLVKNFASQAVIAIENARLLTELRQRTDELAQRQAELSVTFDNMGDGVVMFNKEMRLAAWNRNLQEILDLPDSFFAEPRTYRDYMAYLIEHGEFGDVDLETELRRYLESVDHQRRVERTRPDGRVLEVRVNPVPGGGFVAIYSDVTERKKAEETVRAARDAAESALRELKSAQDRLVQTEKLASLGQLTAGIAHEIKNPLNFVNNFSAVSVELIDELREALGGAHLDSKLRAEISEIADTLQGNLDKVVQHGKRADAIVKNMLLHSRHGSGEHRPVDINALVDESLNLAYHGARAEKQGFTITLERSFDPAAGEVDLFPQEITRALLNLISNGFYAATKRKAEANGGGYEPTVTATTNNLGDSVEIRIRDNGTGIPPEVKEKLFNPFFTTKPAGEGTGLGLSISHDIIVKQHGGSIEVDTQPGEFTEFRIVLPRAGASLIELGERTGQ